MHAATYLIDICVSFRDCGLSSADRDEPVEEENDVFMIQALQNVDLLPQIFEVLLRLAVLDDKLERHDLPAVFAPALHESEQRRVNRADQCDLHDRMLSWRFYIFRGWLAAKRHSFHECGGALFDHRTQAAV